ncbi:CDP-alcohol phosphatidyltransferase family protein [Candidatus Pacearchaeota archaeon]|nr:CDP-alcohol phosphatidyltransferase family protein [Candidatus Pacearchaeota archaeon]
MKKRAEFDSKKALYAKNPVYLYGLLDKYTVHVARWVYNFGLSANAVTLITFFIGILSIAAMFIFPGYKGIVIAAVLLILRNLGDTIDGKIARGSGTMSSFGGFSDIIIDWLFFHAAFLVSIGFLTGHEIIGFLSVLGYMSREFARTKFTHFYGAKITETNEAQKISGIVSIVKKYDLATVFLFAPIFLLIGKPEFIIYLVAVMEYSLLMGELFFDFMLLHRKKN